MRRGAGCGLLSSLGFGLLLLLACRDPAPRGLGRDAGFPPQVQDASREVGDGGTGSARPLDAPADVMVWAAERAVHDGDLASARRLVGMALAKLGATLTVQPAAGLVDATALADPDPRAADAPELLSDFAANGSVLAVGSGGLLSAIDLRHSYRLLRLASHPATIRQVKVSADGRHVATFADDQILRLFSLPTGALALELPLSLDFLSLGDRRHAELFAFSPDSRRLFSLDCGERSGPACPLLRMRVFETEHGERRSEISLPAEPLDYTSRSDGTVAVLPQGGTPRFFDPESGMEWPQTARSPAAPPPGRATEFAAAPGKPDPARSRCQSTRLQSPTGRPWLISPERRFLLTLAAPDQLCLWDIVEHRLARPIALPKPLSGPILLSLLADARWAVLAHKDGGRPVAGQAPTPLPEILRLTDAAEGPLATAQSLGRAARKPPYPLSILPLDQGGAFWTAAPPTRRAADADPASPLAREPDGQVCLLAGGLAGERGAPFRCLPVPGLWQQADGRMGPLAISGDGRFAFFGSQLPLLLEQRGRGPILPLRLPAAADPRDDRPSENAEILDDGRLVTLDVEGRLHVYTLPAGERTYSPAEPPALVRIQRQDGELRLQRRDGGTLLLSLSTGLLRRLDPGPGLSPAEPVAAVADLEIGTTRASLRIAASGRGALRLLERRPSGLHLRIQFLPESPGAAPSDRRAPAAVVIASDGRYERIGDVALSEIEPYVICRVGPYQAPLAVCGERFETKGLWVSGLALLRATPTDSAAPSPGR